MEFTEKDLSIMAGGRVGPRYRRRIYAAGIIAVAGLFALMIPGDGELWQTISGGLIVVTFAVYVVLQARAMEIDRSKLLQEWGEEIKAAEMGKAVDNS